MSQEFKTRYAPGIWEDTEGALHFSLPEILAHCGLEATPENEAWLQREMVALVKKNAIPGMTVIVQPDCPHCGVHAAHMFLVIAGWAQHKEGCPLK